MNLGCGSVQPEGWDNVDQDTLGQRYVLFDGGIVTWTAAWDSWGGDDTHVVLENYDYIVCNHMLSDIGHHDLVPALKNIRAMLRDGGVLRILVPDLMDAVEAYENGTESWFPQDDRTGGIHAKFCTFVTWFGESRSVFTRGYLFALLSEAGFWPVAADFGSRWLDSTVTAFGPPEILELEQGELHRSTALIVEAVR